MAALFGRVRLPPTTVWWSSYKLYGARWKVR
jgi:hypothetical protein